MTKTVSYIRKPQRTGDGGSPVRVSDSRTSLLSCSCRKILIDGIEAGLQSGGLGQNLCKSEFHKMQQVMRFK